MARSSLACTEKNRLHSINTGTEKDRRQKPAVFSMEGAVKAIFPQQRRRPPAGRPPTVSPAERVTVGSEEIPCPAKKPRRKAGIRAKQGISELVRAWGLEPQRREAREPKGNVTLVKAGRRLCQWCLQEGAVRNPIFH